MMFLYKNQIDAANEVFDKFKKYNTMALMAQMQSGKTGTYCQVIRNELINSNNRGKKAVILLMDSNNALKTQISNDVRNILGLELFKRVEIFHRNDYKKIDITHDNTAIMIIDEAHIAQSIRNTPASVVQSVIKAKIKLLLVSATLFDASLNNVISPDNTVCLIPGEGYYGINQMFQHKRISQSTALFVNNKLNPLIEYKISSLTDCSSKKYAIIRVHSFKKSDQLKKALTKKFKSNIDVVILNSRQNNEEPNSVIDFSKVPKNITIVIVNGFLRVGEQLNTSNLAFIWDTPSGNTDTIAQSLAGRCCGYNKLKDCVEVFTDREQAINYSKMIENNFLPNNVVFKTSYGVNKQSISSSSEVIVIKIPSMPKKIDKSFLKTIPEFNNLIKKYPSHGNIQIRNVDNLSESDSRKNVLTSILTGTKKKYTYAIDEDDYVGVFYSSKLKAIGLMEKSDPVVSVTYKNKSKLSYDLK